MENTTDEPGLPPPGLPPPGWAVGAGSAEGGSAGAGAAGTWAGGAGAAATGTVPAEQRPVTGEPRVDAALARLDELPELPVTEHRAVFEHVHRSLSEVLGELDTGSRRG
jgi:hypothetical protein